VDLDLLEERYASTGPRVASLQEEGRSRCVRSSAGHPPSHRTGYSSRLSGRSPRRRAC